MGRRMERKYHSHLSVVTLEARHVRPGPERAEVASSPAHASRGSAETQRGSGFAGHDVWAGPLLNPGRACRPSRGGWGRGLGPEFPGWPRPQPRSQVPG